MTLSGKYVSEFLGTAGLLIVVVGSGIMGESLSQGNTAIALLANSLATGAGLYALIRTFESISGAHLNPAVSFVQWRRNKLNTREFTAYILSQVLGALTGVGLTHFMFGQRILQISSHDRGDFRFLVSEFIATFGLILLITLSSRRKPETTPSAVALFITSAYWCTSSTSFANPAVTIARAFTETFSGILWTGGPGFIGAQVFGALAAMWMSDALTRKTS